MVFPADFDPGIPDCEFSIIASANEPNDTYKNKPLIYELTSQYLRSPRFRDCVKVFVDYGLEFDDKFLLTVLLNDAAQLKHQLNQNPSAIHVKYTLDAAFTPMYKVSLLHICRLVYQRKSADLCLRREYFQ